MIQRCLAVIAVAGLLTACATPPARPVTPTASAEASVLAKEADIPTPTSPVIDTPPQSAALPMSASTVAPEVHHPVVPASRVKAAAPKPAPPAAPKPKPPIAKPTPAIAVTPAPVKTETATLSGRLQLVAGPRQQIAVGEVADGLVYFLPKSGGSKPKPGRYTIATQSKGFSPNLLVVPVGSTVAFPNKDTILHNVYSRTPGSSFNLDTYAPGESREVVLRTPGLVIVNCNVHHNMRANVVVLSTPYYTRPAKDGSFQLSKLPPGPGTLVFWHPRSAAVTQPVNAGTSAAVVKQLTATKPRLDAHMLFGN